MHLKSRTILPNAYSNSLCACSYVAMHQLGATAYKRAEAWALALIF